MYKHDFRCVRLQNKWGDVIIGKNTELRELSEQVTIWSETWWMSKSDQLKEPEEEHFG